MSGNREVYAWNHEDDSGTWVAPTVIRFLKPELRRRVGCK
jgi:hypothetical protein